MSSPYPMKFSNEKELQLFMAQVLDADDEVLDPNNYRADLVTDDFFIEVKPYLTPAVMDKAAGQLARYRPYAGDRALVIAGLTPKNFDHNLVKQAQSFRDAEIGVWFVDQEQVFIEAYEKMSGRPQKTPKRAEKAIAPFTLPPTYVGARERERGGVGPWPFMAIAVLIGLAFYGPDQPENSPAQFVRLRAEGQGVAVFDEAFSRVGRVEEGTPVEIIGKPIDGFQQIRVDGQDYWIQTKNGP